MSLLRGRKKLLATLIALAVVAACLVALQRFLYGDVTINEARVRADMITLRSEFDGQLTSLRVGTADLVSPNQVIATIDHRQADAGVVSAEAKVESYQQEVNRLLSQLEIARAQREMDLAITSYGIDSARSALEASKSAFAEATRKYRRSEELGERGVLSTEHVDSLRLQYEVSRSKMQVTEAGLATAILKASGAREDYKATKLIEEEIKAARANLEGAKAGLTLARIKREKHDIRSPDTLIISRTFAAAGDSVRAGQRLVVAHNPASVRIEANVRESELSRIKHGARARVVLDAFPGQLLEGLVSRVGSAAMSEFSVLPSDSQATFVRVAQRVPIEIEVDWQGAPPAPGLLARVYIASP